MYKSIFLLPVLVLFLAEFTFVPATRPEAIPLTDPPSFVDDVFPIMEQKCNLEECHGGKEKPHFTDYEAVDKKAKRIGKRIIDRNLPMPPRKSTIRLTKEEIQILSQWVKAGAPNN